MSSQHGFSGPLYEQVHEVLRNRVLSGEWGMGVPLPGEMHLSRELGVSVGTVRKAMDKLASARMVVRERGRGTFIATSTDRFAEPLIALRNGSEQPIKPVIDIIDIATRPPTASEQDVLKCRRRGPTPPTVVSLRRNWTYDGRVVCNETITVDAALLPLHNVDIPAILETLFDFYAKSFGVAISRVGWAIKPISCSAEAGQTRSHAVAAPINIQLVRTAYDAFGTALEISEQSLSLAHETYQVQRLAFETARG